MKKDKKDVLSFDSDSEDEQFLKNYNKISKDVHNKKKIKTEISNIDNKNINNINSTQLPSTPSKTPTKSPKKPLLVIEEDDDDDGDDSFLNNNSNTNLNNNNINVNNNNNSEDNVNNTDSHLNNHYNDDINYEIINDDTANNINSNTYNGPWINTLSFSDLISKPGMKFAIVTGYSIDIKWVMNSFERSQGTKIPITFIRDYDQKKHKPGPHPIPFSNCTIIHPVLSGDQIFHAKLLVLVYDTWIRIAVTSANPSSYEYSNLSQSIWYQDFYNFNNNNNSSQFQSPLARVNKTTTTSTYNTPVKNPSLPSSPYSSPSYKFNNTQTTNKNISKSLPASPASPSSKQPYSPYRDYSSQPSTPTSSPYRVDFSFKTTLKYFLQSSGYKNVQFLDQFDFSTSKAQLIISIPGEYKHTSNKMGLERLRYHVNNYYKTQENNTVYGDDVKSQSIQKIFYYQSSSVGLSTFFKQAFVSNFKVNNNITTINTFHTMNSNNNNNGKDKSFHIIYPTARWVKETQAKQKLGKVLSLAYDIYDINKYDFSYFQIKHGYRKNTVSHSKIIVGVSQNSLKNKELKYDWCYSGSHNISSAAWGSPSSRTSDLSILNYEMGILLLNDSPSLNNTSIPSWVNNVPFQIPAPSYHYQEKPYISTGTVNKSYFKKNR
ncbi:hypothetical protein DICPUDRAFT_89860 [Dictyostelium purpureum]|uniref:Uncharacterized protein n=1 Tax=Dictyostelium purpureum TaxID=5786 RepID=F0ZYN3_DICPU|nr:uncharacterized protein DICPUDRAFT_89860 [Dictyostelium purpureum]EGC30943.1 hypothetical protein DICPUDRAFT_89860 [Dictyostelium purpureum]|eukprot:XP_003292520.1 hypothetical protein DICPUDRAFT_89860 [Dictyostelium purpureum]